MSLRLYDIYVTIYLYLKIKLVINSRTLTVALSNSDPWPVTARTRRSLQSLRFSARSIVQHRPAAKLHCRTSAYGTLRKTSFRSMITMLVPCVLLL